MLQRTVCVRHLCSDIRSQGQPLKSRVASIKVLRKGYCVNGQALKELLEFYEAAGVDAALGDAPIDRFAQVEEVKQTPAPIHVAAPPPLATAQNVPAMAPVPAEPAAPMQGLADAQGLANQAKTIDELRAALLAFDGCGLKKTARQLVFADGNPNAKIMLIGEAPGREEDAQGLPFVGQSGQLLDKMLAAVGLDRSKVYIANVIFWRPPGNRTPSAEERAMCEPFIRRQIELVRPKVMMTLGGSALSTLFEGRQGIMRTRGQVLDYMDGDLTIPTVPTLHPAALLRKPLNKRLAWQDLLALQALMEQNGAA